MLVKIFLLSLVFVSCSATQNISRFCAPNLKYCFDSYEQNKQRFCNLRNHQQCSVEDWNDLCVNDLRNCQTIVES